MPRAHQHLGLVLVAAVMLTAACSWWPGASGATSSPTPTAGSASATGTQPRSPAGFQVGARWQYQLSGRIDEGVDAQVFDIDLFNTDPAVVASLHAKGKTVLCYFEAGAWEPYRPDSSKFPESIRGKVYEGFTDERWLDIRRLDILGPLLASRADLCKQKGFDGIEFDNMEGYQNKTGFSLTADDQLKFNYFLSDLARSRGLLAGLKNDVGQVPQMVSRFDFTVNEQCFESHECEGLLPFIQAGKPVFNVEYKLDPASFCGEARRLRLSSIRKRVGLDAWIHQC